MFGGITELEFLARIAGEGECNSHEIIRETFKQIVLKSEGGLDVPWNKHEDAWKKYLFDGFKLDSAPQPVSANFSAQTPSIKSVTPSAQNLEVIFYRDSKVDDGRYANNGWMQELPDPITKMTWDNAVLISRKTARELGVANGDLVEISLNGQKVIGPIWTQPGMADYSLGLALGYGREKVGRVGNGVGFNAYKIFNGKYIETNATIRKTDETHVIAVDHMGGQFATRLWWALTYYGHDDVSVLDGGWNRWVEEDRPIETGPVASFPFTSMEIVPPRFEV